MMWVKNHEVVTYPFTDPAVSPLIMYFCRERKIITMGIEAIIEPAAKGPQFCEY
jgi:hypothetical protein